MKQKLNNLSDRSERIEDVYKSQERNQSAEIRFKRLKKKITLLYNKYF